MKTIAFYTLGCKTNQYETQALKEEFLRRGFSVAGEEDFADVYVVNTCTVTGLADRKSRQYIRRARKRNPDCLVAVAGCYAQMNPEEAAAIEGVDLVVGTNEKGKLPDYVEERLAILRTCGGRVEEQPVVSLRENEAGGAVLTPALHIKPYGQLTEYEETGVVTSMESRTRAYLKIQEGCNQFCSYCVIPYARGALRSRRLEDIVNESKSLISQGFQELVLTGINAALYGREQGFSEPTAEVQGIEAVVRALNELPGEFRIRIGSLEPTVVNGSYIERLLAYHKLCHHMHLSLQSGSSRTLQAMNRHYSREDFLDIVKLLRRFDPAYGISTDIIVGFPGETEEDFQESVSLVEAAGFCRVHVFPYSKRKGTKAAEMEGQIAPAVKKERARRLAEAADGAAQAFLTGNIGRESTVLFEEYDPATGICCGYADNYIRVYCPAPCQPQGFARLRLSGLHGDGVLGELKAPLL